ncbi:MAG: BMP family ABC transporter substrate-binding protein, partial [Clostridia bacterium]|nr:BMP family ABC transporter substrate-binding protein [Clostridia bacterium]
AAGYMQGTALEKAAKEFPDVKFIFIDGWAMGLDNEVGVAYKEEQCGYLAGYAVVMDGFEKLGFSGGGGGTNPACMRYGYGFIQGANDAAAKLGKQVEIKFSWAYGATFSASAELQTLISGWYETGTEIVFACGGPMFDSITAAASANDAYVIGVDDDQSYLSETVLISALKGVKEGAYQTLAKVYDGTWEPGVITLGAAQNAVGLPMDTSRLESFTKDEYDAMMADIISGVLAIDDQAAEGDPNAKGPWSNVTVDYIQ